MHMLRPRNLPALSIAAIALSAIAFLSFLVLAPAVVFGGTYGEGGYYGEGSYGPPPPHEVASGTFSTPNCNPPLNVSCTFSPTSVTTGQNVTWSASASGGTGTYTYEWSGSDNLSCSGQPSAACQSFQRSYSTTGNKSASVTVRSGSASASASCQNGAQSGVTVMLANTPPNAPTGTGNQSGGSGSIPRATGGGISQPPGAGANGGSASFGESPAGACSAPRRPTLTWLYSDPDGDAQSGYQVQIDNNSNFSSPEHDTGQASGAVTSYQVPSGVLAYNTTYFWRVRVWDNRGAVSNWSEGTSFAAPPHQAPSTSYNWAPANPTSAQSVVFTDQGQVFGGSTKQSWSWTFPDAAPSSSSIQNPTTRFLSAGDKSTSLILRDSDNLSCGLQQTVTVTGLGTPGWKEVPPE